MAQGIEFYDTQGNIKLRATEVMGKSFQQNVALTGTSGTMTITIPEEATDVVAIPTTTSAQTTDALVGQPVVTVTMGTGTTGTLTYSDVENDYDQVSLIFF